MMYPRLRLARNLLSDDGSIFISIDDREIGNIRKVCDEIFGEENFFCQLVVQANKRGQTYKQISKTHEYLLIYSKSQEAEYNELEKDAEKNDLNFTDDLGSFNIRELRNRNPKFGRFNRPGLYYAFYVNPDSVDKDGFSPISLKQDLNYKLCVYPENSEGGASCWRWGPILVNKNCSNNTLNSNVVAKQKRDSGYNIYEKYRKTTYKAKSIWDEVDVITEKGTVELGELGLAQYFDFPKPVGLLKKAISIATLEDDIVLDFFSGSATTAHAVMKLNAEDGGKRRFIMVQLPEPCDEKSEAFKAGYKNICEIGKERIRRAGAKIKSDSPLTTGDLDVGFKVFKLDSSNIRKWNPNAEDLEGSLFASVENYVDGRTEDDVVYEIMIKMGVDISQPVETREIAGHKVYSLGAGALMICLDDDITTDVASGMAALREELGTELDAWRVVFRDNGFASDSAKTNAKEILKCAGLKEEAFLTI